MTFTSSRVEVVLALSALCMLALPSCKEEQEQINRLQVEIRTLTDQQAVSQGEINRLKVQINSQTKECDGLKEDKAKLEKELKSLRETADQMQKDFAAYRKAYKISMRTQGIDLNLGELIVDGKKYANVVVKEVTDELLSVIHDAGPVKFAWDSLPAFVRKRFGIERAGEFPLISFKAAVADAAPLTAEERIRRHDQSMSDFQREIARCDSEIAAARKARSEAYTMLSKAKAGKLNTVPKLQGVVNELDIKITNLEAEKRTLEKKQKDLLMDNPHAKRLESSARLRS